ncbi:PVC-type heme-binding CxxCH protein [Adhaeretor mobilis]|nr:PVC-type heme-binding CxxCH protein [Adhaeretor mobilis]
MHRTLQTFAIVLTLLGANLIGSGSATIQAQAANGTAFEFHKGDRIAILGNGMADRMQHDGWMEAHFQMRFPKDELVFRNLGFTGDELTIRGRSAGFGSPEDWLKRTEASVVFAFFGYNESFRDEAGIEAFKKDLTSFIKQTRNPSNDATARRLVLFSPIAYEDLADQLLPAANEMNRRLLAYSNAMAEVAKQNEVPFIDLFHPSLKAYEESPEPLTINGVHLNEQGNHAIAQAAADAMFGEHALDADVQINEIRQAIQEKNHYWFQRYRATDGFSIFGGRKGMGGSQWTPKNEPVMLREMEVLDVMTANRDQQIWAVAQGLSYRVNDSNAPPQIPVATNRPGPLSDGTYPFLGGEEAISEMTLPEGLEVNLFASEEQFPELQNPVQASVDTKGRLWVSAWPSYPHWRPGDEMNDKLLILEDTDHDGRADKCKVFADGLHNPTGFEFYNGGVYVAQVPDIWFFKDTDGDDVADIRQRVIGGIDSADTHHSVNSFVIGPGGGLYFQEGLFHHTQAETPHGPPVRVTNAGVFRYDPVSKAFEAHADHGFANPHGHVFDYWGDDIIHDGTGAVPYFGPTISGRTVYPAKHRRGPTVYRQRTRPCAATAILSSEQFPEKYRDTLLVCNVIGDQGVLQYRLNEEGAGLKAEEIEPLIMSSDPNFRPVDLEVGSDGALYVLDWQNPLIGHLQHNLRDSSRDHRHGRVYRIKASDRELLKSQSIVGESVEALLDLLQERDNSVRYRAKIELSSRPRQEVQQACERWLEELDPSDPDYEHHMLEALWVHQHHHLINESLLRKLLESKDYHVRAAAGHVLRAWREQIADADTLIGKLVQDEHPRVRLAGVLTCSDIDSLQAAEMALVAAKFPTGEFLDFAIKETTQTLEPIWKNALASGEVICADNPAGLAYLLRCTSPEELLELAQPDPYLVGVIKFPETTDRLRLSTLKKLAKLRKQESAQVLIDLVQEADSLGEEIVRTLVALLQDIDKDALASSEDKFLSLAANAKSRIVRQAALAALARIDSSPDRVWQLAGSTSKGMSDLLDSVAQIPEAATRGLFYHRVRSIMLSLNADTHEASLADVAPRAVAAMAHIPGHEPEKLEDLLGLVDANLYRSEAVDALSKVARKHWQPAHSIRMVAATIARATSATATERSSADLQAELKFASRLASQLPDEQRAGAQATLEGFGVAVLHLGTVPHRMIYDESQLAVQAGSAVQLIFTNTDNMPHNFVLIQPGQLEKLGMKVESEASDPAMVANGFVPRGRRVLAASRLLQPGEKQVIEFRAPRSTGVYPYVCTYPGHWRRMFGALYVVNDVSQYAANPKAYAAEHRLKARDALLKNDRPLKNWTFEELKPSLDQLAEGRNFDRGLRLFQRANCITCHDPQQAPGAKDNSRFAPDLTKLDPKLKPSDILQAILQPSNTINEQYQTSEFFMDTGKTIVGFVTEESDEDVTVVIDPLVSCEPIKLAKEEIEERAKSKVSLMPAGLLDRLTEEEILELCAYLVARGDRDAAVYQVE